MILWRGKGNLPTYALPIITSKVKKKLYLRGKLLWKYQKSDEIRCNDLVGKEKLRRIEETKDKDRYIRKAFFSFVLLHTCQESFVIVLHQKKIQREYCFLIDDKTEREKYIADVDKNYTKSMDEEELEKKDEKIMREYVRFV